ncbi:hypothetical protein AM588_10009274 [Phytophthora nicotianae]|uniref:5-formyltetrahydrofolate cyclo-ligase n=1 Tax=Phytophthora nicotianae TaxID=4792 RepID=A0A0W8DLR6_PHYNI|nr:hypothetical protein AM588_10009274 [Phytophthora nicotianae]
MAASLKKELRRRIGATLKALPDSEVTEQSRLLAEKICALPEFARARGISVYLEMPKEAATSKLLEAAFAGGKKDKWQIPDPPLLSDTGTPRDDAVQGDELELVLLPGVAFDRQGGRLGHGKGYYVALGQDLYELLGVSSSATASQMKRACVAVEKECFDYRKMSLKYHPDKQTEETREAMKEEFVKITNGAADLDNYDASRTSNFDEAARFAEEGVEDSLANWVGLVAVLALGIIPIVVMQRNRTKPLKKRREVDGYCSLRRG